MKYSKEWYDKIKADLKKDFKFHVFRCEVKGDFDGYCYHPSNYAWIVVEAIGRGDATTMCNDKQSKCEYIGEDDEAFNIMVKDCCKNNLKTHIYYDNGDHFEADFKMVLEAMVEE